MRRNELTIGIALAVIGLIAGFWLVALSPKRERAASLGEEVEQLRGQLEQAEQAAAMGEQQRKSFPMDYRRLVVLGKAVPEDGDQGSLLVQLQQLSDRTEVRFQALELAASAGSAVPAAPPVTTTTDSATTTSTGTAETTSESSSGSLPAEPSTAAAAPTEASAAALPIGASVGPAGLPVMPYALKFTGDFFAIADFLGSLDNMVRLRRGEIEVHGRLLTVDSFALQPADTESTDPAGVSPIPTLTAEVSVTSYLTPAEQGLTAGASPTGPATATPAAAAAAVPGATSTSTAAPSP